MDPFSSQTLLITENGNVENNILLPVQEAAQVAGRRVSLLRHGGAAMDHPLDPGYPEGQYLTNLLLRVA